MRTMQLAVASILLYAIFAVAQPQHTFLLYSDQLDNPSADVFSDFQNNNGEFIPGVGWQATSISSQLYLKFAQDLPTEGTFVIDVTNFNPVEQNQTDKQQIINLYSQAEGSKETYETDAAWWNIRTGTNYTLGEGMAGFKFLSAARGVDTREETRCIEDKSDWDVNDTYEFKVSWTTEDIYCYFDNLLVAEFDFTGQVEDFQYVFLGTDNVYQAQPGPIYSNLRIYINDPSQVDLSFTDVTKDYKTEGYSESGYGHGISFADVNRDGAYDIFASNAIRDQELPDMLFINQGGWFAEQASPRGTLDRGLTHSIVSFDLDNDGDLDNFFANMSVLEDKSDGLGRNSLYLNNGDGYYTNTTSNGISRENNDTRGAIALDINNDGLLDLYTVNWGQENEMYLNLGGGKFDRVDRGANGPDGDNSAQQGVTAADFDNDGDIDIYVSRRETYNWLLVNDGNGYFTDMGDELDVDVSGRTNGAVFVDIDKDADLDLFVLNSAYTQGELPLLRVFINNGDGTFKDKSNDYGINTSAFSAAFGDVDNDADMDMFLLNNSEKDPGAVPYLFLNDGHGNLEKTTCGVEVPAQDARAVGFGDIDNDGDIDFYLTAKFGRNYLLRNDLKSSNHYIDILCIGPGGDYGGFGSKVYVYEPGYLGSPNHLLGFQESVSNTAYLCQNQTALHFGLAQYSSCDIRIIRTDGQIFDFRSVSSNQIVKMNEYEPAQFSLHYESGDNQEGFVNEELPQPFVVRVCDQSCVGIAGVDVTFAPQNGGHIVESQPIRTNSDGLAQAHFISGPTAGRYEIVTTSELTKDAKVVFHAQAKEYAVTISKNDGDAQVGTVGQDLASPIVVSALYENGNVASHIAVNFFVGNESGSIHGQSLYHAQTDAAGNAAVVWTLGEKAGQQSLYASFEDQTLQFTATAQADEAIRIVADTLSQQTFQAGKSYPVSCQVCDQFGNVSPDQTVRFSVESGFGSVNGDQNLSLSSDADGRVETVWTLGLNHTFENILKARIDSDSVRWTLDAIEPPLLTNSTISARDSITADGVDSTCIVVQLLNENDQPLPDYPVKIYVNGQDYELRPMSKVSDAQGYFNAIVKSTFPETKQIYAEVPSIGTIPDTLAILFYEPIPTGVHLVKLSALDQTITAGQQLAEPIRLQVVDQDENPVSDKKVFFHISNDQASFDDGDSLIVKSDVEGQVSIMPHIGPIIRHDSFLITATIPDEPTRHTFRVHIVPDRPDSIFCLSPDSLVVNPGDSVDFAIRLRDQFGNNTPGIRVNFSSNAEDRFIPDSTVTSDSLGIARIAVVAGKQVSWHTITAFAESLSVKCSFHVRLLEHLVKMSSDTLVLKNGDERARLQIKCLDAFESPVADMVIQFSLLDGSGEFEQSPAQKTNAEGFAEIVWQPDMSSFLSIIQAASQHDSVLFYIKLDAVSSVKNFVVPSQFALGENYPNPFNPTTTIPFSVPHISHILIDVYNVQGQKVRTLIDNELDAGEHIVVFDMVDDVGRSLPSGVYFYKMMADGFEARKRLLLLK